jgi:multiple antibiotic resistance protein
LTPVKSARDKPEVMFHGNPVAGYRRSPCDFKSAGGLPVFLAITEGATPAERSRAGLRAAFAATIILAAAALAGRPVLAAFGISMPALQAAGGLVVLLMGLEMLHGAPSKVQQDDKGQQSTADRILVPLAMPLLAGPGAITTVLTLSARVTTWSETMLLLIAVVTVGATIGIILASATRLWLIW